MRHNASAARNYDRKFGFSSPDERGGRTRTAAHRYVPSAAGREGDYAPPPTAPSASTPGGADAFSGSDFKARWWPAPGNLE